MTHADVENVREQALGSAMALFWSRGAEVASYNEIVAATGLSRKALYGLWPDKEAIVRDTLDYYREKVLHLITASLNKPGGYAGLLAFWRDLEGASKQNNWRGCYLFRTASGPLRSQAFVSEALASYLTDLKAALGAQILKAQSDGDIAVTLDPEIAGLQAAALLGMISAVGAGSGYNAQTRDFFAAARVILF